MSRRSRRRRLVRGPAEALGSPSRRDRPPPPPSSDRGRSRWPGLGTWIALLVGAQIGRAIVALPEGLADTAGIVLSLALAVTLAMAYRRWARRTMAARRRPNSSGRS